MGIFMRFHFLDKWHMIYVIYNDSKKTPINFLAYIYITPRDVPFGICIRNTFKQNQNILLAPAPIKDF